MSAPVVDGYRYRIVASATCLRPNSNQYFTFFRRKHKSYGKKLMRLEQTSGKPASVNTGTTSSNVCRDARSIPMRGASTWKGGHPIPRVLVVRMLTSDELNGPCTSRPISSFRSCCTRSRVPVKTTSVVTSSCEGSSATVHISIHVTSPSKAMVTMRSRLCPGVQGSCRGHARASADRCLTRRHPQKHRLLR
jgi:hypothetical protein